MFPLQGDQKKLEIPVIVAGRINRPEVAEQILQERKADIVAMARGLVVWLMGFQDSSGRR